MLMWKFISKIPPNPAYRTGRLPLPKGGITPLWKRGVRGDFLFNVYSIIEAF